MTIKTHRLFISLACAVGLLAAQTAALAADAAYPSKPIRLVVGFAAGGGTDIAARLLGQKMSEVVGQPFIIDNRAGATGMIGAKQVATSAPDGYTLLMGHVNSQAIAPASMDRPPYDPVKDFAAVAYIGSAANVLVVASTLPARNMTELLALARSQPKGLSYGSPGVGSTNHLAGELLQIDSKAPMVHVPYRGSSPAMVDLLAGQIELNFDVVPSVMPNIKTGLLRPLAVTTPRRDPELPDVPTMVELGFTTFDISNWYGLVAPAGTPPAIVKSLYDAFQRVVSQPDVASKLSELGVRRRPMTPEEFDAFIQTEVSKYRDIAQRTGVRMQP